MEEHSPRVRPLSPRTVAGQLSPDAHSPRQQSKARSPPLMSGDGRPLSPPVVSESSSPPAAGHWCPHPLEGVFGDREGGEVGYAFYMTLFTAAYVAALCVIAVLADALFPYCDHPVDCYDLDVELQRSRLVDVSPCQDMFAHVCGRWSSMYPNQADQFSLVNERLRVVMLENIDRASARSAAAADKAGAAFLACASVGEDNVEHTKTIRQVLHRRGLAWPAEDTHTSRELFRTLVALTLHDLLGVFFQLKLMPSLQDRDRFVFEVKYAETMFRYVTDAAVMADCMRAFDPDVDADRFAVEVIKVEEDVKAITQTLSFGNIKIRYYKFKDIDTFFDEAAYLQAEWWVDAINENIPEDSAVDLESNFLLRDKHAFFLTEAVVKAYKTKTVNLENYIAWKIIKYLSYAASTKMFFCHYAPGTPPWMLTVERTIDRCHGYVKLVMPYALLRLQTTGILDDATITFANHIAQQIRHSMELSYNASWLDHESAQVIVKRLRSIHQIIGTASTLRTDAALDGYYSHVPAMTRHSSFIEWLVEAHRAVAAHRKRFLRPPSDDSPFSVSRDDWELTGLAVGAFYIIVYHIIYVPGSILMPPFLMPRGPNSFNYGAIGKVIGHELTHAFDREYLDINEHGEEQQLLQSTRFKRKLDEILDCLIVQANKMTRSAIAGNNSISETFADNAGVDAAYIAYRTMRQADRQGGIASLSPDQAFFAGSCYMFCQANETVSEYSAYLPHNLRCNQPCMNTQEFADAYGCPEGSPMRPSHRCDIHDLREPSKPPALRKIR